MCGVFVADADANTSFSKRRAPVQLTRQLPLLTSVRVVTTPRLAGLYHVADAVSQYIDCTHRWSIAGAARIGSVWLLQRLQIMRCFGGLADLDDALVVQDALRVAAGNGHVAVLEWLVENHGQGRRLQWASLLTAAATHGHELVLRWLDARGFVSAGFNIPALCVGNGSVACLQWLIGKNVRVDFIKTMEAAAAQGHLQVIEWLHQFQAQTQVSGANGKVGLTYAAQNGHLHVLQWFHKYRPQDLNHAELMNEAAQAGRLPIVQWLHKVGGSVAATSTSCSGFAVGSAAMNGHLEVVQWLLSHRSEEFPSSFLRRVARNGHLHVLKWLYEDAQCRELFTEGSTSCVGDAADGGHLEVVQWLHEVQPPHMVSWRAIDLAASNGHLEVVKWLHEHRSDPCCARAMDLAASKGHLEVVRFLHTNRSEGCTQDAMDGAARHGHLDVVRFLHENRSEGCTFRAMDHAAWNNHFDVVKFLHSNRQEGCSTMAMHGAANHGNLEMLQFLHTNRPEGCTQKALVLAISARSLPCVQWLLTHYPHLFKDDLWLHQAICMAQTTPGTRHILQCLVQYLDGIRAEAVSVSSRPTKRIRTA